MTTISDILEQIRVYSPDADIRPVMSAYLLAADVHKHQKRKSGEAYLTHPLAVAKILADMGMDIDTISCALLHDALEDSPIRKADMVKLVGEEITALVDGVTKIGKLRFRSKEELAAENFRKMMLAMSRDLRVILVKLADRLHNMRTIDGHRPDKQKRIAQETLNIYAPIANRLGLTRIKSELENICFRAMQPEAYDEIASFLQSTQSDRQAYIQITSRTLEKTLADDGVTCAVSGRAKHLFSIQRKMEAQHLKVHEVHDLIAFRVIVPDLASCYHVLGLVHAHWPPIPERIKDYIARPKPNGYQSLHTTVLGENGRRMEIQIRTQEMHRINEDGIAAHWRYKEGRLALSKDDVARISRIREVFENAKEVDNASDYMEALRFEFYADEVFVFTPANDVKAFPAGATALDFAYAVHTEVGNHCTGAKAGGRMVPLRYEMRNGDIMEILTSQNQKPNRGWLKIARTGRAIQKIRRFLREEERELGVRLGRDMIDGELKRFHTNLNKLRSAGTLKAVADARKTDVDSLYLEVARGQTQLGQVIQQLLPEGVWKARHEGQGSTLASALFGRWTRRTESPVLISGEDGVLVNFAKCCSALPGEPISGYITRGRGITVHAFDCKQLRSLESERTISVEWDPTAQGRHSSQI
ncbi:MAG: guanosine-3',5'-bis(diphosphate) 3'-pyrophosphohydrolase, partial [Kiritimatiellia bacterium]